MGNMEMQPGGYGKAQKDGEGGLDVLVLLSTYNGERFLKEQLESILAQEGCRVGLVARDDGSTDSTKAILQEYAAKYPCQKGGNGILSVMMEENVGISQSFLGLAAAAGKLVEKNEGLAAGHVYFAFADQDDIWQADKLAVAIRQIQGRERLVRQPYLYACAAQPIDEDGRLLPYAAHYGRVNTSFGNALVENICIGCTCVFNWDLLQMLGRGIPEHAVMHDFWLYLVASSFGEVIYDPVPHILYRQHGGNVLGMASTRLENCRRRIRNFKRHRYQLTGQAKEYQNIYWDELPEREKKLLEDFIGQKAKLAFCRRVYRQKRLDNAIMKLLLLLKWL